MRLLGYIRTRLVDDLGEHDLEEQERALAEFCSVNDHNLVGVAADEGEGPQTALNQALNNAADGLIVTDSLVISDTVEGARRFITELVAHKKHLFIVLKNRHVDPSLLSTADELVEQSKHLLSHHLEEEV